MEDGGRIVRECEIERYTMVIFKMDNQKGPIVPHNEFYSVWRGVWERLGENGYLYMYGCVPLWLT